MKKLMILIGNIGTGKSTLAKEYVKENGYIAIARDQLRYAIGDGHYIFNYDYEKIIWEIELELFNKFINLGVDIIVDEVGITKAMRARYIPYALIYKYKITAIVMPHLTMKEAVDRRMNNPHGQDNRELWEQIYSKFEAQYEEPTLAEGFDEIIHIKGAHNISCNCSVCWRQKRSKQ